MKVIRRIGKNGINTTFIINKSFLKKKLKGGGCQDEIDKEIENKDYNWLQLEKVIQSITGKGISTLIGKISTKDVIIKIQEAKNAEKEYKIQNELKNYNGFIKFECLFYCDGDKNYIESFSRLEEKTRLCNAKGVSMGVIIMPYYKNGSLEKYKSVNKYIIKNIIMNYFEIYNNTGFIHGDFYPKNIIIDDEDNPLIIDFENSYFNKDENHTHFWRDLSNLLSTVNYATNLDNCIREHCMMNGAYNKKPTLELIKNLIRGL